MIPRGSLPAEEALRVPYPLATVVTEANITANHHWIAIEDGVSALFIGPNESGSLDRVELAKGLQFIRYTVVAKILGCFRRVDGEIVSARVRLT
jgi:hypothetical protein